MKTKTISFILASFLASAVNFIHAQNIGDSYPIAREVLDEGVKLHDEEKYDDAIKKFITINKNDSFYTTIQHELANSYMAKEEYEKAKIAVLNALSIPNDNTRDLYLTYANALESLKMQDSAHLVYDNLIKNYPYYYRPYYEKGLTYQKQKQYNKAVANYTLALQQNIFHPASHYRIGILAANANQPALALMALQMYCMLNNRAGNVVSVYTLMEKISNNEYTPELEVPEDVFFKNELMDELNLIILSKGAISSKYKSKVDLDFYIIKQLQVMMEKLPKDIKTEDWALDFYIHFYKTLWDNNHFEGSILESFTSLNNKKVQSEIKSKSKQVDAFTEWANSYLNALRNERTLVIDSKEEKVKCLYDQGIITAVGQQDSKGNKIGHWTYYAVRGAKSAEGNYNNSSKKIGKWLYYFYNGNTKYIENFSNSGNLDGEYYAYYENGALQEKSKYVNGNIEGDVEFFNLNNTLQSKLTVKNNTIVGVKYTYDENGNLSTAGEMKEGKYQGWYKTYHPNGQLNLIGTTVNGELEGKVVYHHSNGMVKLTGTYTNGKRSGKWLWKYNNGQTETEGNYINGKETGIWLNYYESGNKSSEENYENGVKRGVIRKFDYEGILYSEHSLKGGVIDAFKYFGKDGKVLLTGKTTGGKLDYIGYSIYRNKVVEGQIINGKDEGEWKYYYENGALDNISQFKDGNRTGFSKSYHKNGAIKLDYFYVDGNREGFCREYYINGKVKAEGYYRLDQKNGPWTIYNINGTVDSKEFYHEGTIHGSDEEFYADNKPCGYDVYDHGVFFNYYMTDTTGKVYNQTNLKFGTGEFKLFTVKNKLYHKSQFKACVREGISNNYFTNGSINSTDFYENGNRNGMSKNFYENGKLRSIGKYVYGSKDSIWTYYNEDGSTDIVCTYKHNELNGSYTTFYANGKKERERTYVDGERQGVSKHFAPDGTLLLLTIHDGGVLKSYSYLDAQNKMVANIPVTNESGTIKTFYPNGKPAVVFTIEKGLLQGDYIIYNTNGKPLSHDIYKDHLSEGISKEYYENGSIKSTSEHTNDELNGVVTTYYENGKTKSTIHYLMGMKHGVATYYDINGKLTKTSKYLYDKLYE